MTKKTENGQAVPIDLTPSPITATAHVSAPTLTVVATLMDKEPLKFNYDPTTPSGEIVKGTLKSSGINLEEVYVEQVTETLEISRGLIDGGAKLSITLPDFLGGGGLQFERKPQSTKKTTKRVVYKRSKK